VFALLAAVTSLSQFYRVSNSVIGPELAAELHLGPAEFGIAGGAFFVALLFAQIPVGMAFDRWGARRTVTSLSVLAIFGAVLLSRAANASDLVAARFLVGVGCSASFMSAVFLCSRWFPGARYTMVLSWVFACSNLGTLAAATPLAWASSTIGWRAAFVALGGITAVVAVLFHVYVRDDPPGKAATPLRKESLAEVWQGLLEVWRTPGLGPVFAIHTFTYATMVTVLGVWAGPYLFDVHGLDSVARGNVLLAMAVAQIAGLLCFGPMDRVFGTRKKVVICGSLLMISVLASLAALESPALSVAIALLVALPFTSSFAVVVVAQGRALFAERLTGRGVTTVNIAQVLGSAALPIASGYIVGAFVVPGLPAPEAAYRAVFASLAACNVFGLLVYLRSRDSRPRG